MLFSCLLIASISLAGASSQPANRLNVVVICADALSAGNTGFEGHPIIKTPNLDKLAAASTRFTRAYTAVPQTTGSRMSILTGRYPHSTGVMNETDLIVAQATSFSEELARAGYACGLVGSWRPMSDEAGKKDVGKKDAGKKDADKKDGGAVAGQADQPALKPKPPRIGLGFDYYAISDPAASLEKSVKICENGQERTIERYLPDWQTDRAIEFIRQAEGKPFCLCLFYALPSMSLHYPPGTTKLYPPTSLPLLKPITHDSKNQPPRLGNCDPIMKYQSQVGEKLQQAQSKYYAMVTRMDENVGRLLEAIDELDLGRNTIVVFTSAKGFATGETGVWGNGPLLWEPFVRCPLLVRMPGAKSKVKPAATAPTTATASAPSSGPMIESGLGAMMISRMVSLVDIAPTLLEAVGLKPSPLLQGRSMMPLLANPNDPNWPDECFIQNDLLAGQTYGSRAIVAGLFKFVDYLQEQDSFDQLYDLKRDPNETRNVVNDPGYGSMSRVMRHRLERWRKRMRDTRAQ